MADLKGITLTMGIDTPASQIVLRPREEFVALTGRPLGAYRYYETHYTRLLVKPPTMTFSRNHLCIVTHVTLLISTVYVFNTLFTTCKN